MSKITVCTEREETKTITIPDINNINQDVSVKLFEYDPIPKVDVVIETDYLGNIYIKHTLDKKVVHYIVSLDSSENSGIILTRIKNPSIFKKNLEDAEYLKSQVKSGIIKASNSTLSGRAYESLKDMNDEEREDYILKNDFASFDPGFHERKYFWVQYDENDEPLEGEEDDTFYLNGVSDNDPSGIIYSKLLSLSPGSFDTLLIQGDISSKSVLSNIERIDGYCTSRLTIYTLGFCRVNFVTSSVTSRLCMNSENELLFKKIS
jgi:hypothetical protein